jgi:hypothetical protein
MIKRNNAIFEIAAREGAEMSRDKRYVLASEIMLKVGLPYIVIDRMLYEPHNIRSTDYADSDEYNVEIDYDNSY